MEYRIVIIDLERTTVAKIVSLTEGGYFISAPYHAARQGWLGKHLIDYRSPAGKRDRSDLIEYVAEDRVKMTHHKDGFVQFSKIDRGPSQVISGRDPESGEIKGLGVMSAPIGSPITSGPTFALVTWGLAGYEKRKPSREDVIFERRDIYYHECDARSYSGRLIEGMVFHPMKWGQVKSDGPKKYVRIAKKDRIGSNFPVKYRVLPLGEGGGPFLGLAVCRLEVNFPSESGFVLNSPSDRRRGEHTGYAMFATYPRDAEIDVAKAIDLTYRPPA